MSINQIEKQKKKLEGFQALGFGITIIGFILFIPTKGLTAILFVLGMIISGIATNKTKKLSTRFKTSHVKEMIESRFKNATFEPQRGFSNEEIIGSGILKKEDRMHSEDFISGYFLDQYIEAADVKLQDVRSSGKSTTVVTVFEGRLYKILTKKRYDTEVFIVPKNYLRTIDDQAIKFEVESIHFTNLYDIITYDQTKALLILTPRMIEKILELNAQFLNVRLSFVNQTIYAAIYTKKDTFDLTNHDDNAGIIEQQIEHEMAVIKRLIEYLT